ncbi:hypothetical protein [Enterococcus thailandicus]|uniref:hypothetical protein n=1 Tax=Enterococcus thailandicus TaxID=417368 RepID=UPI0022E7BB53|nr:hypothetical protein [Enterococcus thailandicus]
MKVKSLIVSGMLATTCLYQSVILSGLVDQPIRDKKIELSKESLVNDIQVENNGETVVFKNHRRIKRNELTMLENRISAMEKNPQVPSGGGASQTLIVQRMARLSGSLVYGMRQE